MLQTSKALRKKTIDVWRNARKAPMFLKASFETKKVTDRAGVTKTVKTDKVVYRRSQRLINCHAYNVCMSGAANYVMSVLKEDGSVLREEVPDEGRSPWLPGISSGATCILEQFLCAYAQQATRNASFVRKGLGTAKRLNAKMMEIGFNSANDAIFGSNSLAPRSVAIASTLKVVKGKKEVDKDFEPPAEEDEVPDAEEDDASGEDAA